MRQKRTTKEKEILAVKLFDEHGQAIFRFALRLTGNHTAAEDITSETILAGLQKVHLEESQELTRNYLFGIALNKWRRSRPMACEPISDLVASASKDLEQLIDLETVFRTLPVALKESFILVKAEGMTSKEAAAILNIPHGTVQARVHDAIHRMRDLLQEKPIVKTIFSEVKP